MSRPKFDQLPEPRKARIIAIAAEQFAKSGFQGTSYNQLLARIGLGKGSAYYYFADKQDLFLTVVRDCYGRFFRSLSDLAPPATKDEYWNYVEAMNLRGLEFMVLDPISAAILLCFRNEREFLDALSGAQLLESLSQYYRDAIRLGQRLGAVRGDLPLDLLVLAAQSVAAACDQWALVHLAATRKPQRTVNAKRFTELMRRLLEDHSGPEAPAPRPRARRTREHPRKVR